MTSDLIGGIYHQTKGRDMHATELENVLAQTRDAREFYLRAARICQEIAETTTSISEREHEMSEMRKCERCADGLLAKEDRLSAQLRDCLGE